MSDEGGDRIDGEEELAAPDWRVRAGAQKQTDTQGKRTARSNTRTLEELVCTLHDGQRPHPITTSQNDFINMRSVVNAQTLSEESITCIADKEDRHQNIMSSVALKMGVEEPWTIERVAKFIELALLSYTCFGGKGVGERQSSAHPMNRMHPRYTFGIWSGTRNNSLECVVGIAERVLRARKIRRLEPQQKAR